MIMAADALNEVAQVVLQKAQSQGYVVAREIRAALESAGLPTGCWREVVGLLQGRLFLRRQRYHHLTPLQARARQELECKQRIGKLIKQMLRRYREFLVGMNDRRAERRFQFIRSVKIQANDGRETSLLSLDVSASGLRLIGRSDLRGQRIRIEIPGFQQDEPPWKINVQIVWSAPSADGLTENGGVFLGLDEAAPG